MQKTLFDSDKLRKSLNYPHIFPLSLTHPEFPADDTVSHQMGMPLGCVLCPFTSMEDRSQAFVDTPRFVDSGTKIARCGSCSAYINPFCEASPMRWFCSLCGARNGFTRSMVGRQIVFIRVASIKELLMISNSPNLDIQSSFRHVIDKWIFVYYQKLKIWLWIILCRSGRNFICLRSCPPR